MQVGTIVTHPDFSFPAKVRVACSKGYMCIGYTNTGVDPNRVFQEGELRPLTPEQFDELTPHEIQCLVNLANPSLKKRWGKGSVCITQPIVSNTF